MLDGKATDTVEGSSLSYRSSYIDIYSCCWGPKDDGKRFGKPGYLASKALKLGAERVSKRVHQILPLCNSVELAIYTLRKEDKPRINRTRTFWTIVRLSEIKA